MKIVLLELSQILTFSRFTILETGFILYFWLDPRSIFYTNYEKSSPSPFRVRYIP